MRGQIFLRGKIVGLIEARELISRPVVCGEAFARAMNQPLAAVEKITTTRNCHWTEEETEWKPKTNRSPPIEEQMNFDA